MNGSLILLVTGVASPLVVGIILWFLGEKAISRRLKSDAIRDLMTFRGAYDSIDFRRSLNRISVTFHDDEGIRKQIRELYEAINSPSLSAEHVNRKIVGLIYDLCQKYGFEGITEYDIDQAFPESKQTPDILIKENQIVQISTNKNKNRRAKKP